jgi:hypothetical protein
MQPQYAGREWRLFHVRPWTEDGFRHPVFLPDRSLRYRRLTSTRRRGGVRRERDGPPHRTNYSKQRKTQLEKITISNHAITTSTTNSSEQNFKTLRILPLAQLPDNLSTPSMRRTPWRRVRLLMVSRLPRASTAPANTNEHASNNSSASTTVTSALHAAHTKQATIARGSQPLGRLGDRRTDIQNKALDGDGGSSPDGHVHDTAIHWRRRVNIVTQKHRRAGKS